MAMKRCPVCGEKYSDTYRKCPFCEEDALQEEEEPRRSTRRGGRSRQFNLITPTLIVLILIMAALLVYLLYGDKLFKKDGGEDGTTPPISGIVEPQKPETNTPPVDTTPADGEGGGDGENGGSGNAGQAGTIPDTNGGSGNSSGSSGNSGSSGDTSYEKAMALPGGLSLNKTDFTRSVSEGAYQLRATGGSGTVTWVSEDPGVASVDATGKVTPISAGTVNIVATDGSKKGVCIVRVKGTGGTPASSGTTSTQTPSGSSGSGAGSSGSNTLNREDMTISVGETFRLKVSGVTTGLTWSVGDAGIASVAGDGTVTGISKGMTNVTVSWDGQSRKCIVRVK